MHFTNLTIGKRLAASFGIVLTLLAAVGGMGYWSSLKISEGAIHEFQKMLRSDAAIAEHSANAWANVLGLRRFEKDIFLNIDSKEKTAEYQESWKKEGELLRRSLKEIEKAAVLEQDTDNLKTMKTALEVYESGLMKIFGRIRDGRIRTPQEGNQAAIEFKDAIHGLEKAAHSFSAKGAERMAQTQDNIRSMANGTVRRTMALVLISIAAGFLICLLATRGITRPLKQVLGGLSRSADKVASASVHTATVSQELSGGASQQAAAIQETSSSLEELTSMTKQNAANADRANQIMAETKEVIMKARSSMESLTASMKEISKAGEETSKIIRTIDEIAFQTNLLALNAAVEAARAGEAGAGFAVVANEVRNLALRAAEAATNTTVLIEETIRRVKEGSDMVDGTSSHFSRVENSSGRMGELIAEIAAASTEQAQGLDQISRAVTEMDSVVQKNAGHAEESASASEAMSAEARQMKGYVAHLGRLIGNDGKTVIDPGTLPAGKTHAPTKRASECRRSID